MEDDIMSMGAVAGHAVEQYGKGPTKLKQRINLYQYEVPGSVSWWRFVFEYLQLKANDRVLELGCGSAKFWLENLGALPNGLTVVLSDFSERMIQGAKETLQGWPVFTFRHFDAQEIPFSEAEFDKVMAMHMLYHVPDMIKALMEMQRVLKIGGTLFCSGPSLDHLKEIRDLAFEFNPRLGFKQTSAERFGLETGGALLAQVFPADQIKSYAYQSKLVITDADAITDYVSSILPIEEESTDFDLFGQFRQYVDEKIKQDGPVVAHSKVGLFIVKK